MFQEFAYSHLQVNNIRKLQPWITACCLVLMNGLFQVVPISKLSKRTLSLVSQFLETDFSITSAGLSTHLFALKCVLPELRHERQ